MLNRGRFTRSISIEDESEGHNPNVTRAGKLPSFMATRFLYFRCGSSFSFFSVQVFYLLLYHARTDESYLAFDLDLEFD